MKKGKVYRAGITLLLPALMLQVVLFAADPPDRAKVQYEGEDFTAEYETLLGRFDGNYVSITPMAPSAHKVTSRATTVPDPGQYKESLDTLNLFYVYFPHYRKFLARQSVAGRDIPARILHLDDLFFFRAFHGEIYKSDNMFDRAIADYKQGEEIAREAQRIEIDLIETEHEIWMLLSR